MKVEGAKQVHYESGPNMTPLVDVVMVILIFLMLAGSFGTSEHFMASKTPIHSKGGPTNQAPDPNFVPPILLEVQVDDVGRFFLPGEPGAAGAAPTVRMENPEQLKQKLEQRRAAFGAAEAGKVEVVLRPDPRTKWETLAPLYDAALRAKYDKVSFAATGG